MYELESLHANRLRGRRILYFSHFESVSLACQELAVSEPHRVGASPCHGLAVSKPHRVGASSCQGLALSEP